MTSRVPGRLRCAVRVGRTTRTVDLPLMNGATASVAVGEYRMTFALAGEGREAVFRESAVGPHHWRPAPSVTGATYGTGWNESGARDLPTGGDLTYSCVA